MHARLSKKPPSSWSQGLKWKREKCSLKSMPIRHTSRNINSFEDLKQNQVISIGLRQSIGILYCFVMLYFGIKVTPTALIGCQDSPGFRVRQRGLWLVAAGDAGPAEGPIVWRGSVFTSNKHHVNTSYHLCERATDSRPFPVWRLLMLEYVPNYMRLSIDPASLISPCLHVGIHWKLALWKISKYWNDRF